MSVVFLVDVYSDDPDLKRVRRAEISTALAADVSCAIVPLIRRDNGGLRRIDSWVREQIAEQRLQLISHRTEQVFEHAIIVDHTDFRHMPAEPPRITAQEVVVLPALRSREDGTVLEEALVTLERYFGRTPRLMSMLGSLDRPAYLPRIAVSEIGEIARLAPTVGGSALVLTSQNFEDSSERASLQLFSVSCEHGSEDLILEPLEEVENLEDMPAGAIDLYLVPNNRPDFSEVHLIVKLMAEGTVIIANADYEPILLEGAVYADGSAQHQTMQKLIADPDAFARQSREARLNVRSRFSRNRWLDSLGGSGSQSDVAAANLPTQNASKTPVLMMTSNGVGLGHLTRLMAIARRLPDNFEPVFFSLSKGAAIVEQFGYTLDYLPSHRFPDLDEASWNRLLARRLVQFIRLTRPKAAIFDGNWPYAGLVNIIMATPELHWIWVRRALWRRKRDLLALERSEMFDAVVEPGELCRFEDIGPTAQVRDDVLDVSPALFLDPSELFDRPTARARLGAASDEVCVVLQLGAGTNFDFSGIRSAILEHLKTLPKVRIVQIRSPISEARSVSETDGVSLVSEYPSLKLAHGIDLLICSAGYNSFHEAMAYGVPAIFIPNESPDMDDQLLRARYAQSMGWGWTLQAHETSRAGFVIDRALSGARRSQARPPGITNGAAEIAQLVENAVSGQSVGRALADCINRI